MLLGYYDGNYDNGIITNNSYVVVDGNGKTVGTTQAFHDFLKGTYPHVLTGVAWNKGWPMGANEILLTITDYARANCSAETRAKINYDLGFTNSTSVAGAKEAINGGNPVILTILTGRYEVKNVRTEDDNGNIITVNEVGNADCHNVVAYGYDANNRFMVHFGWQGDSYDTYKYTSVVISDLTLFSYFWINHSLA